LEAGSYSKPSTQRAAVRYRDYVVILTLLDTRLRVSGELCNLKMERLSLEEGGGAFAEYVGFPTSPGAFLNYWQLNANS